MTRVQCEKCPWKKSTDPHEIPNGYSEDKHRALECTIARGPLESIGRGIRMMACHESDPGEEKACVGWLVHQIGPGNNIGLRLQAMRDRSLMDVRTVGPQHESFEATLPKKRRRRRS